ncbi:putative ribonuclease H-like domain-containing protein [Tanacetum coccineum]
MVEPKGTATVQHSKLNANSELKCVKFNGCMLSDNHDLCILDFINNVNARVKSKSIKKSSKRKVLETNRKGVYKYWIHLETYWKPTDLENKTPKPVVTLVYSRKPRKSKTTIPVNKSKASKTKSWLWHRRLSHLNFGAINHLARHGLVRGLPKLKFEKDHLCSACATGKSKKKPHKPKSEDTNLEKLYLLHMDLYGPMRVASVNGKKSKDEDPNFIIKFLKMIQVRLKVPVQRIRTNNGTEFVNQTLREYYDNIGISHETSVARSSQQNGVVERRNRTLIEAARTMLIYAKAPLFLWAEVVATASLKADLRKLKGKALVDNDVTKHPSDPKMLKIDVEPITQKLLNNRTAHSTYIKHTQEEVVVLRDLIEHVKANYPLDQPLESACRPTGRTFTIVGIASPLSRITTTAEVPPRKPTALKNDTPKHVTTLIYSRKPRKSKVDVPVSKPKILKSVYANNKEPSQSWGSIVSDVLSSSLDECRVYYVEGLGQNLFSIGQLCDSNLEVAFCQHTCFIRNLKGVDLLTGSRGNNMYTLSLGDMMASSPIFLLSKASKTKSWLWHRRLSHLNFGAMGKSKKKPHKRKSEDTNQEKLYLLHMDLCGPMRVASVNGKKYILVIVDDYSRFTWVKCLRSKDEAPDFKIKFLKMIQVGISHETSVARSPQQNGVVEKQAIATGCYTQNRSIICLHHGKTPYELLHDKLPDLSFLHVFGALYYPTNDSENLGKLQPKADIGIFIGYAPTNKVIQIYNQRTRRIIKIIHVYFDELTAMASEHSSLGPALHEMTPATISSGLMPNPTPSIPFVPPSRTDLDLLFQPLFDELLTPPPSVDHPAPKVITPIVKVVAPKPTASTGLHSLTTVDLDAPSPSNSQTTPETQSPIIPNDVEEDNHDLDVAHMNNDPFFAFPILENDYEASSSSDIILLVVHSTTPNSEHVTKWSKDHPLENIIGKLERPISTRLQLHKQALFCYYNAFLTLVEPKNYKDILTQTCWIEAIQEELIEFEHLKV